MLKSALFNSNPKHLACQTRDAAHYTRGQSGPHIGDVQAALNVIDDLGIERSEWDAQLYGPSTAAAVLAFKRKRKIINHAYENTEDEIVGKMTITALDNEIFLIEAKTKLQGLFPQGQCLRRNRQVDPPVFPRRPFVEDGITLRDLTDDERDEIA